MELAIFLSLRDASLEHARISIESLARTLPPGSGEVIVVDQTTAGFSGALPRPDWRMVRADRNAALALTGAHVLCFLEAETVLMPGWLPPMLALLRRAPRAGCIGNVHREPYSGLIDHAGIGFDADGLPVPLGRTLALLPLDRSDRRAAVSMACALVRRDVFEPLGGFDARFRGALGDVDFCLRAAEAGYRHFVANRSVVYCYDTAGSADDDPDLPLYRERWGQRAALCHARRERLHREPPDAPCSPELREMARETRRLQRLEIRAVHGEGWRYLTKHWYRPWRYNAARISRALGQARTPLPAPILLALNHPADTARVDDGWLFDPPPQP